MPRYTFTFSRDPDGQVVGTIKSGDREWSFWNWKRDGDVVTCEADDWLERFVEDAAARVRA